MLSHNNSSHKRRRWYACSLQPQEYDHSLKIVSGTSYQSSMLCTSIRLIAPFCSSFAKIISPAKSQNSEGKLREKRYIGTDEVESRKLETMWTRSLLVNRRFLFI